MKDVRKIAMIYREIGTCGGIQRGASFQVGQFREWGYEPIVLTEKELGRDEGRAARLAAILREQNADIVIEHDTYNKAKLSADIAAARDAGVPFVLFWHSVFSCLIASGFRKAADIYPLVREAAAVIALTKTDEAFFRLIGLRALAIPYCDADLMEGFTRRDYPHRVVWMGRFVPEKRVKDAVLIAKRLREKVSDAELVILGGGTPEEERELAAFIRANRLPKGAVTFAGYQKDVRPYLESAGAGLVTSEFEGFCHAIVEMKMASLPVVSYAMPYLETLKEGTGAVQVAQGDVEAAADRLAMLFSNPDETARHGARARRAYEELRAFDQRGAYERLFADLAEPDERSTLLAADLASAPRLFDILVRHGVTGLGALERRVERRLTGSRDVPGIRGKIGRLLVKLGKRFCGA